MDANKVKKAAKMLYFRAITSAPAPVDESFEMNPGWNPAAIRVYSRPFAV